jgi:hypothetical protein
MVKVYRFRKFSIALDDYVDSRRWATPEAVWRVHGELMTDVPPIEVDLADLGREIEGMTVRDFTKSGPIKFPTHAKR